MKRRIILQMRHTIVQSGSEVLKQKCSVIDLKDILQSDHVNKAVTIAHEALSDFRKLNGFGRAIAAPQLGFSLRFIAVNLGTPRTMFNPEIVYFSDEKFSMWDDCLSFPNLMVCVERHKCISVQFINESGETEVWENCSQVVSELLQHEVDHLNGILSLDIAVSPPKIPPGLECNPIIDREEWLKNRNVYMSYVDEYFIPYDS
jgi:peptide deformylase